MYRYNNPSVRAKIALDLALLALITVFLQGRSASDYSSLFSSSHLVILFCTLACWFVSGRAVGLYKDFRATSFSYEWTVFLKTLIVYSLLASFLFSQILKEYPFELKSLFLQCSLIFIVIPIQKIIVRLIFKYIRKSKQVSRKVLIVGAGDNGLNFYNQYVKGNNYGYSLTGFIDDNVNPSINGHYLGKTADIATIVANYELDDIVVTLPIDNESQLDKIVTVGEKEGKRVRIVPYYQRFGSGRIHVGTLGTLPIITLRSLPLDIIDNKIYKRVFDLIFAGLVTILILSWLIPIISLVIKFTSRGPVFFKQERWGLNNKPIVCYKFRTMVHTSKDIDEGGNYQQARKNDPRITGIGKFLRKTSLDELPQFFNVLLGSMSVIGPRPHPVPLNIQSKGSVENYMMRHWVKPGITGWAQVNGFRGETRKPYLMQKRVEFDVWYMENWTFWLDLQIILQTVVNMFKSEDNAY